MPKPFYNEQAVVIDGETVRLVIDYFAMDATEQLLGISYDRILDEIQKPGVPLGFQGKVLWGLLRKHHPEISWDEIASLLVYKNGIPFGLALTKLYEAAFPLAETEKGKNPPKPRGASKPSSRRGAKKG